MAKPMRILTSECDGADGLLVTFSDGTTGAYVAEELLELRPIRERTMTKLKVNAKASVRVQNPF
jgi:hypothetical protein